MIPRRVLFGSICVITAFATIILSGPTTIQEAAATTVSSSSMRACLCSSCDGDVTSEFSPLFCDGEVDVHDLLKVLADWEKECGVDISPLGDANRDGFVDQDDLDTVLNNWGSCP